MTMMTMMYGVHLVGLRSAICVVYHDRDRELLYGDTSRL